MQRRSMWVCVLMMSAASAVYGAVRVAKVFSDHMVLQRDMPVAVWGFGEHGETVTVAFSGATAQATVDADGRWQVELAAMTTDGEAHQLTVVSGAQKIDLNDILIGDVWICGGQSNMGRPVNGEQVKSASLPKIRLLNLSGSTPRSDGVDDVFGWAVCSPETIARAGDGLGEKRRGFTEVGFVFGRRIYAELGVPVGLIQMNCGGSTARDWTPKHGLRRTLTLDEPLTRITHNDGLLHEIRMRGTVPFAVRGVVWYQGEDDGRNKAYGADFANMIAAWRELYRQPSLPFYFAQIAQTTYASGMLHVWEGQQFVMNTVAHTGMAVSNDIYRDTANGGFKERIDPKSGLSIAGGSNPHPTGKELIAERLARIALDHTYGREQGVVFGPMYERSETSGDAIRIRFKHAGSGLKTVDGEVPNWFEISDGAKDRNVIVYVPAKARIVDKDTVEVRADDVAKPKYVRFGWHPLARFNLINADGLPAVSFRTDRDDRWRVAGQE